MIKKKIIIIRYSPGAGEPAAGPRQPHQWPNLSDQPTRNSNVSSNSNSNVLSNDSGESSRMDTELRTSCARAARHSRRHPPSVQRAQSARDAIIIIIIIIIMIVIIIIVIMIIIIIIVIVIIILITIQSAENIGKRCSDPL